MKNMKRIIHPLLLLLPLIFTFSSCHQEIKPDTDFTISSSTVTIEGDSLINFTGARQNATIEISTKTSTNKWTAICPTNDLWLTYSIKSSTLSITVDNNESNDSRSSYVTVILGDNHKKIAIRQDYNRVLKFSSDTISLGASKGNYIIPFTTNIDNSNLSVSHTSDWISNASVSDNQLILSISRNSSISDVRKCSVTVEGDGLSVTLLIIQNPMSGYPYFIPIDTLQFDKFPIYEIWDMVHSVKIGEICNEYLYKFDATSNENIVKEKEITAYPYKDGVTNLVNGLVVSNGGKVSWSNDFISTYSQGTLSTSPDTIYMAPGATEMTVVPLELSEDEKAIAVTAVCKPLLIEDTRNGEANSQGEISETYVYTVVKIGMQYWMRENLRTTRYPDGTNIPTGFTGDVSGGASGTYVPNCHTPACAINIQGIGTFIDANDPSAKNYRSEYGVQYNIPAVIRQSFDLTKKEADPSVNMEDAISPQGWTIPTIAQYETLLAYITQQSGQTTSLLDEILISGGNITGFSAIGSTYRSNTTGRWNSGSLFLGTLDYFYDSTNGHCARIFRQRDGAYKIITYSVIGTSYYMRCIKK